MSVKRLTSALTLYQKYSDGTYDSFKDFRDDMAFNLKNGADIIIEEEGIHVENPFQFNVQHIADWSRNHENQFADMLVDYSSYVTSTVDDIKRNARPRYELYGSTDGYDRDIIDKEFVNLTNEEKYNKIISKCQKRLAELRRNGDNNIDSHEVDHRRQNIFNIKMIQSNYDINHPMSLLYTDRFALTNQVTLLQSVWENGSDKHPYVNNIRTQTIGEILEIASSKLINNITTKEKRPVVLPLTCGDRIIGDEKFLYWSGLQVFDIDLKFSEAFQSSGMSTADARDIIFDKLRHYPWFISTNLSISKKGIHIFTKVSRMHHLFDDKKTNIDIAQYWYRMSYVQKYAAIRYVLINFCDLPLHDLDDQKAKVIDAAMAQPNQLTALSYDAEARFNPNFIDLYPVIYFHKPPVTGLSDDEWLTHPAVLNKFSRWFSDFEVNSKIFNGIDIVRDINLNIKIDDSFELNNVKQIDINMLDKGDRYRTRYRVANTIMDLYGNTETARLLVHHILQSEKTKTRGQINSFISSAVANRKKADMYMVHTLQKLGLKLEVSQETDEAARVQELTRAEHTLKHSNYIFRSIPADKVIQLQDNEYLAHSKDRILSAFDCYKLNLIESPPNTGKTTLFKELAKTHRVCMVSPFTSTIESKIVTDKSIAELFDVYYGDKQITEIKDRPGRSAVMTFDKFSRMPRDYYQLFDYIVIDESHLLFTSTYRLEVVSQTVESIREYLLTEASTTKEAFGDLRSSFKNLIGASDISNEKEYTTFIMMSGTITCEADYFSSYEVLNYIKIVKRHPFKKTANFVFCQTKDTKMITIYELIAENIRQGHKVLHPTNSGDGYAKKVVAAVEFILQRPINYEYYKRANSDEDFLQSINTDCSTKDIELLFSTDYLSVGIDIEDIGNFRVIYNTDFTAEDIEQFNNRLRRTDIDCTIVCDVLTDDGQIKPSTLATRQISYTATEEIATIFKDEKIISKLQQHIHDKQGYYIILGELFSRYFIINQSGRVRFIRAALEIEQFEAQFREIARGLLYIKTSLHKKFGYSVNMSTADEAPQYKIDQIMSVVSDAFSEYRLAKSDRYVELLTFASSDLCYTILSECKTVKYVRSYDEFDEDAVKLHIGYDSSVSDGTAILTYNKAYKFIIQDVIKLAMKFRKFYGAHTVKRIIDDCRPGELLNYAELNRYIKLMYLLKEDRNLEMTKTTKDILRIAYEYIPSGARSVTIDRLDYDEMLVRIHQYVHDNVKIITDSNLQSERRLSEINRKISGFIDVLFKKKLGKETVKIQLRKIYEFNSSEIMSRLRMDEIFNKIILNIDEPLEMHQTRELSEYHLDTDYEESEEHDDLDIFHSSGTRIST